MNISEAIEEFLIEQRVRGNSSDTYDYYINCLKYFLNFIGDRDVNDLNLTLCKSYYLSLCETKKNSITIQTYVRGVRSFLKWLYLEDKISIDICARFRLPKCKTKVINVLSDHEVNKIYEVFSGEDFLSKRNKLIISLLLDSGLRLHELVCITLGDVNLEDRYIIVNGKGDKQRFVPFGSYAASALEDYVKITFIDLKYHDSECPLIIKVSAPGVFIGITNDTLKDIFRRLKISTGIKRLKCHLLRHTFATRFLENGGNIYVLKEILGHTTLKQTQAYLHIARMRVHRDYGKFSPLDNIKKPR